jgi:GTP cyclohydrolase II
VADTACRANPSAFQSLELAMLNRSTGSERPEGKDTFVLPRSVVLAEHSMDLATAGRVGITIMMSQEKRGRYVLVVTVGTRTTEPIVRVHSSCLYGDTLGSLWCDCGEQLRESLTRMKNANSGILIYLNQEGRGAGLGVKALAHELAERLDFDCHGAYAHLGFESDMRTYSDAVRVLKLLAVGRCILLTNNPAKVEALESGGILVRQEALSTPRTAPPLPKA